VNTNYSQTGEGTAIIAEEMGHKETIAKGNEDRRGRRKVIGNNTTHTAENTCLESTRENMTVEETDTGLMRSNVETPEDVRISPKRTKKMRSRRRRTAD
jgi:hypothetical protein